MHRGATSTGTKQRLSFFLCLFLLLAVSALLPSPPGRAEAPDQTAKAASGSDHWDGKRFFNPWLQPAGAQQRSYSRFGWVWRFTFSTGWPAWPETRPHTPAAPPPVKVPEGAVRITAVGHATFLIQMDGLNVLTDPMWSQRASPVSWTGPKRHAQPGIGIIDLPPIDWVLVSHNHYDHLDLPTLERLAANGVRQAATPLGNGVLVKEAGIADVHELDWWESLRVSDRVTVTLVPARHFSSRGLWDRNKALWGGFVIAGPSGTVYYAGDTGYGPHFAEIARRFSPITAAILPIAPFRPDQPVPGADRPHSGMHMGPLAAVMAHKVLGAKQSIAAHFQVFQLGPDGFDDAVNGLAQALKEANLAPGAFIAPKPGQVVER